MAIVPNWYINRADQSRASLLLALDSTDIAPSPRFFRDLKQRVRIGVVQPARKGISSTWEIQDLTGAQFEVGTGIKDAPPAAGTFPLAFNANGVGLGALAFNISEAALQAAINANPQIIAAGTTVAVSKSGALYTITFQTNGARPLFTSSPTNALQPPSAVIISREQVGDAGQPDIQTLEIYQRPYAYNSVWNLVPPGTVTPTTIAPGSVSEPAQYRIAFSEPPLSGAARVVDSVPQITELVVTPNAGVKAVFEINFGLVVGSEVAFNGQYLDTFTSTNAIKRFWFNKTDDVTKDPGTPDGGTKTQIDYTTVASLVTAFKAAVDADADFDNAYGVAQLRVRVTYAAAGFRTTVNKEFADVITNGVTMLGNGSDGQHVGKFLLLPDRLGVTCVYFTGPVLTKAVPAVAVSVNRFLEIELPIGGTAAAVADAIEAGLNADGFWAAVAAGNTVTVTDTAGGPRLPATLKSVFFGVSLKRLGSSLSANIPWNASPDTIKALLGSKFNVSKPDELTWVLTRTVDGEMPNLTVTGESLVWPSLVEGVLQFDSAALKKAFASTTAATITAVLEVVYTPAGGERDIILQIRCILDRNLLVLAVLVSPSWPAPLTEMTGVGFAAGITDYTGGTATDLDGIPTASLSVPRLVCFIHPVDGLRFFTLDSGVDAPAPPGIIHPVDHAPVTNEKIWKSVL